MKLFSPKIRWAAAGLAALGWISGGMARAEEASWPQFRGPDADGTAEAKGLPVEWAEQKNVVWKVAVPHKGWSTPLVLGGQIWLTSATEDGKEFFVHCLERATGAE